MIMDCDTPICFLCNHPNGVYEISYSQIGYRIKQDIINIFDLSIIDYLSDSDALCLKCMEALRNFSQMKYDLLQVIVKRDSERTMLPKKLAKPLCLMWDTCITNLANLKMASSFAYSLAEDANERYTSLSESPNNLLIETHWEPFRESPQPHSFRNRLNSNVDAEVEQVLARKKPPSRARLPFGKRRRKRRSRSKTSESSNENPDLTSSGRGTLSVEPEPGVRRRGRPRSKSDLSTASSISHKLSNEEIEQQRREIVLEEFIKRKTASRPSVTSDYVASLRQFACDIAFIKPRPASRCKSINIGMREPMTPVERCVSESRIYARRKELVLTDTRHNLQLLEELLSSYTALRHECDHENCFTVCDNLKDLTDHKVQIHDEIGRFWCNHCKFNFITQEHLDQHDLEEHNNILENCPCCSETFEGKAELHKHLQEHLKYQVPCIYCDKYFLRKDECAAHVQKVHKGRKKRIKTLQRQEILARIYKNDKQVIEQNHRPTPFVVRELLQIEHRCESNGSPSEHSSNNSSNPDTLGFITLGDYGTAPDESINT